jgi:uncharacterized membrane protein YqaE (UPF0057 family)
MLGGNVNRDYGSVFAMRLIIAILLPFVLFFTIGRPLAGIICLILQITVIGWLPAAIWAVYALGQYNTDQKIAGAMNGGGASGRQQ